MKRDKLFLGVLGRSDAGKSTTWHKLFDAKVRSSSKNAKDFHLYHKMWEEVFLVNGSPEETGSSLQNRFSKKAPRILFSSLQYVDRVQKSLKYIDKHYSDKHIFWLNPDHRETQFSDPLGLAPTLLSAGYTIHIVDGRNGGLGGKSTNKRIRALVHGWSVSQMNCKD